MYSFQRDEQNLKIFQIRILPNILKLEVILHVLELHVWYLNIALIFMCFNLKSNANYEIETSNLPLCILPTLQKKLAYDLKLSLYEI